MIKEQIWGGKWQRGSRANAEGVRKRPTSTCRLGCLSNSEREHNKVILQGGNDAGPGPKELVRESKCLFLSN